MGQDVVLEDGASRTVLETQPLGHLRPEHDLLGRHPALEDQGRGGRTGLDTEHPHAGARQVAEQVAVVAGHLDDPISGLEARERAAHCSCDCWSRASEC